MSDEAITLLSLALDDEIRDFERSPASELNKNSRVKKKKSESNY